VGKSWLADWRIEDKAGKFFLGRGSLSTPLPQNRVVIGEILKAVKAANQLNPGGDRQSIVARNDNAPTLDKAGISRDLSSAAQHLRCLPIPLIDWLEVGNAPIGAFPLLLY
jgi:hypothetical protein